MKVRIKILVHTPVSPNDTTCVQKLVSLLNITHYLLQLYKKFSKMKKEKSFILVLMGS